MYERTPTAKELQGSAFEPADFALEPVEVWPENWLAVRIFADMRTQWSSGMAGRTGLFYPSLLVLFDLHKVPEHERLSLFHDIRELEESALAEMHKTF